MLLFIIRGLYVLICAGAIAAYVSGTGVPRFVTEHHVLTFFLLLASSQIVTVVDIVIRRKRIDLISAVYFGLLIGTMLSYLFMQAINPILLGMRAQSWEGAVTAVATLSLSYLSISFLLQTKDDFRFVIPYVEFSRELKGRPLILDSSALIDGRIAEVVETRIIDARLVVPGFVLREVQEIADSSDKNRRTRGRRGLDVLSKLQAIPGIDIEVVEGEDHDSKDKSVDERLVVLAHAQSGRIVTSDFNLNKVASVQGVDVINLNDVAAALRPRYLPGETLKVRVQREGEAQGQGVGYLDDGTMVVCEQAAPLIGQDLEATVTSVLQSSAGRMIFARPVGMEAPPEPPRTGRPTRGR